MWLRLYIFVHTLFERARSHCALSSDCYCDSSYHSKWVIQSSMEVFTLCDYDNITNSYEVSL